MIRKWTHSIRRFIKKCTSGGTYNERKEYPFEDETLPAWLAPLVLGGTLALFAIMLANYNALPTPLLLDDKVQHPDKFLAGNAQQYLNNLTSLGVRVGGSMENDVEAKDLLVRILEDIQNEMLDSVHQLEIQTQLIYDETNFRLEFEPYGMTTVFKGCYNVLAKLTPRIKHADYSERCLLLNSHFDTMPDTEGASDAAAMIVVMLEVLRVMSTYPQTFRHCVIFLFNGGEENYMLGSYGFVNSHEWAKEVSAFINLDSAGAGGREIMFQAGPKMPFLMNVYRQTAPHPHASVMGEELFQNNLIPSDSDYRIFRDFGGLRGMDFAFNANGYIYHTKYDTANIIPLGTLQHTGDNILALTKALAVSEELYNVTSHEDGNVVFFDVLGWTMVYYTQKEALVINLLVAGIALLVVACSIKSMSVKSGLSIGETFVELLISVLCHLVGIGFGVGIVFLLAIIYDSAGRAMSWFSSPWLLFPLYMCPFLIIISLPIIVWVDNFKRGLLSTSHQVQIYLHAQLLLLVVLLVVLTLMNIRSAYVILVGVLFQAGAAFLNWILGLQNRQKSWTAFQLLGQVVPILFYGSLLHLALQTFIPITGRDGPDSNPEILIAVFCVAMCLLMGGFIMPMVALCRATKLILGMFGLIWLVSVILMATNVGFPYREATSPQRYWIYHTQRIYHGSNDEILRNESGYFMLAMDRHTPKSVEDFLPEALLSSEADCDIALYCGLPLLSSRKHSKAEVSFWIPSSEPPELSHKTELVLLNMSIISENERRYHFQIEGPPHMGVFLSPSEHMKLVSWSYLDGQIPAAGPQWQQSRDTFMIFYNYGYEMPPQFQFEVTIHAEENADVNGPWLDIALVSHYLFHQEQRTKEFQEFIDTFPPWTYVQAWPSSYESWKF